MLASIALWNASLLEDDMLLLGTEIYVRTIGVFPRVAITKSHHEAA